LLLRVVGIPIAAVADDYRRSEKRLRMTDSAPGDVIEAVIECVEKEHGTTAAFFRDAGATTAAIDRMRLRLRTDAELA